MDTQMLLRMHAFLEETSETNEDTEYSPDQEYLVNGLIQLAKQRNEAEIVSEFKTPFVHPMITVQKWVEELKELVRQELARNQHN